MIAAAIPASNNMPFGWFDIVFVIVLGFGLFRGRSNGMSKEMLPLLQWLIIVFVCGWVHPIIAPLLVNQAGLGRLWGYVTAYLALMILIMIFFSIIKHHLGKNLSESDFFKGNEYYLGMLAGIIRFFCMVIVALAFLNAPVYTQAQMAARAAYMHETYGGGQGSFSGDLFPSLPQLQDDVFKNSFFGTSLKNIKFFNSLFINSQPSKNQPAAVSKSQAVMSIGGQTVTLQPQNAPNSPKK